TTAEGQSATSTATPTAGGTTAAVTSAGRYSVKYPSNESSPRVTSAVSFAAPLRSTHSGPCRSEWSRIRERISSFVLAAARTDTTWIAQSTPPRTTTTPASHDSN